jgi:hypothetical protein
MLDLSATVAKGPGEEINRFGYIIFNLFEFFYLHSEL